MSSWAIAGDLGKGTKSDEEQCFLGHYLDVSQNTSDYPPRVQPGRIRGRPCFEHGDGEERGLDAITTTGAQNQPWPCVGTAGSVHGEPQEAFIQSPTKYFSVFYLSMVALVKHERYSFLICDNSKITSFKKCCQLRTASITAVASFSTTG